MWSARSRPQERKGEMKQICRPIYGACACEDCKAMCDRRTCWPLPQEAFLLLEMGYANRLMLDYWTGEEENIDIVCPAIVNYGGQQAPFWPIGRCTFLTSDGMCEIHDIGKPIEGRIARCTQEPPNGFHYRVAKTWNSLEGKRIVSMWRDQTK